MTLIKNDKKKGGEKKMEKGINALQGAFERAKERPDINLSAQESSDWDQWNNWDDLGGDDPGWGDISD